MKKKFNQLKLEIDSLTVFADVKNDAVVCRLRELLEVLCSKDQTNAGDLKEFI